MEKKTVGRDCKWFVVVVIIMVVVFSQSFSAASEAKESKVRRQRNLLKKDFRPIVEQDYAPAWTLPISEQPKLYMKLQHESVILRCLAEGRPKPTVVWLKDGRPLPADVLTSSSKYEKSRFSLKILDLMSPFDRGNYTCIVSNRLGSLNHTYAVDVVVRLIGAPELTNGPRNQTRFEGESIHLSCSYYSDMESFVYWLKHFSVNDSYIDSNGKSYTQLLQREASNGQDETEWIISNATTSDSGLYSCCATNIYGTTCRRAWIQIQPGTQQKSFAVLDSSSSSWLTFLLPVVAVGFLVLTITLVMVCFMRRRRHWKVMFKDPDVANPMYMDLLQTEMVKSLSIPFDESWMIPASSLKVDALIGEGAFGVVYLGYLAHNVKNDLSFTSHDPPLPVAVKMLKEGGTEEDLRCFLKEIETMKTIGNHINIIGFLGCSTLNGRILMVVEFARYGNLRDFLRQRLGSRETSRPGSSFSVDDVINRRCPLQYEILVSFAYQVARGLEYLSLKSVVHRDVACRNVLLADDLIVKIADFGLTRIVDGHSSYYRAKHIDLLPIRWMAPEALTDNKYTTKSDVWSFGVLVWEIFSLGDVPYGSMIVDGLCSQLRNGLRLQKPQLATDEIYQTMTKCWNYLPQERPTFTELVKCFEATLSQAATAEYLLLDGDAAEIEVRSVLSDEEVFERSDPASSSLTRTQSNRVHPVPRSADSQYSSWSSDHTGSDASNTNLLPITRTGSCAR